LSRIRSDLGNRGVEVVAINILPQRASLRAWEGFWRSLGGGEALFAEDIRGEAVPAFNVRALGTKVIINRKGQVVYRDSGVTPYEKLRSAVERAL